MTMKNWFPVVFLVVAATVYVVWFTGWFRPKTLEIHHLTRSLPARFQRGGMPSLTFILNAPVKLTEIKVVPLAGFATNKNIVPRWHLVSDSNSVPVKAFPYGEFIRGMKPAINDVRPEPLETNVTYRLFITAGEIKGEHDFELQ